MTEFKNYGSSRAGGAGARRAPYRAWPSALAGFAIAYAARLVLGWIAGVAGLGLAVGMGLSGAPTPQERTVVVWVVLGYLVVTLVAAVVVARYLGLRGASRPVVAALAAGFGGLAVTLVVQTGSTLIGNLAGIAAEIVLLAVITGSRTPAEREADRPRAGRAW